MKWFKHYTNAHKGNVLQDIYLKFGVNAGHGIYFRLIEYLADKWDGSSEPRFKILTSELRAHLKMTTPSLAQLSLIIDSSGDSEFKVSEDFCNVFLPKLLEIRHRDALNAGIRSEVSQHKSGGEKNKKKRKKNTVADWASEAFISLVASFKKEFPNTETGSAALPRFVHHAKTPEIAAEILGSVRHYKNFLKGLTWDRSPKTSLANYLGAKDKPFWVEYRTAKPTAEIGAGSMRGA